MENKGAADLEGVMAAVLTPLKDDLSPDPEKWIGHCRWLLSQGCNGLAVLGTTSEANSFSVDERLGMLDALGVAGLEGRKLVPGTGCCALPDTVRLTAKAMELGAAAVLMLPPFYYKPVTDDGLFAAYAEVIERVGDPRLKILLYHIPQNTGVAISLELIGMLRDAYPDTVIGIKDSAGDYSNMKSMCEAFPGFRVFSGSDTFLLPLLRDGGAGSITACNNICPEISADLFRRRDTAEADDIQRSLSAVRGAIQRFPLIEALKEVVARETDDPGWRRLRPPLRALDPATSDALARALEAIPFRMARAA